MYFYRLSGASLNTLISIHDKINSTDILKSSLCDDIVNSTHFYASIEITDASLFLSLSLSLSLPPLPLKKRFFINQKLWDLLDLREKVDKRDPNISAIFRVSLNFVQVKLFTFEKALRGKMRV